MVQIEPYFFGRPAYWRFAVGSLRIELHFEFPGQHLPELVHVPALVGDVDPAEEPEAVLAGGRDGQQDDRQPDQETDHRSHAVPP